MVMGPTFREHLLLQRQNVSFWNLFEKCGKRRPSAIIILLPTEGTTIVRPEQQQRDKGLYEIA